MNFNRPLRSLTVAALLAPALLAMLTTAAGGCQTRRTLATTPNLYLDGRGQSVFDAVPTELRTTDLDILYVTDRAVTELGPTGPRYGANRDAGMSYGSVTISLSPEVDWNQLVADSLTQKRKHDYHMTVKSVRPAGRVEPMHTRFQLREKESVLTPKAEREIAEEAEAFRKLLDARLAASKEKDVYVYVHGFANSFDDAVFRAAELHHFLGRSGTVIAYTWPAGYGGALGYFRDRESGEFTVLHLKQLLMALARTKAVERVHVIAHSRGTDVATTALRELNIGSRARGADPRQEWKIETLILASPDLDSEVFLQRYLGENLIMATGRTVVYFSPNDLALGLSNWLFSSSRRLGGMEAKDFKRDMLDKLWTFERLQFVDCDVSGYSSSHDYEFAHPAVLSDLILALRYRQDPGPYRRLGERGKVLRIDNTYATGKDVAIPPTTPTEVGPASRPGTPSADRPH